MWLPSETNKVDPTVYIAASVFITTTVVSIVVRTVSSSASVPKPVSDVILKEVAVPAVPPQLKLHKKLVPPNNERVLPVVTALDTEIDDLLSISVVQSAAKEVTDLKQSPPVTFT